MRIRKTAITVALPPRKTQIERQEVYGRSPTKKAGGQPGRKGYKLTKVENPDEVIVHDITTCGCCAAELPKEGGTKSRQIFDIPKIKIRVTEHRIVIKTCSKCGEQNRSDFPDGLVQEAQYGHQIKALVVYLQNYQMLPYRRCAELIYDLTGQQISEGTLTNFQAEMYSRLDNFEQQMKSLLLMRSVLHADEIGVKVNGKSNWMHVAGTHLLSFFGFHSKKGKQAIDSFNILPLYNGTVVHDR